MPPIDEPSSFEPKPSAAEGRKAKPAGATPEQPASANLVALTVDPAAGRIVKIERVDAAGARQELSEDQRADLTRNPAKTTLERLVEQAFEAGIDCVLGVQAADKQRPESESEEDAELSRVLLRSLMDRSGARRLMERDVLNRAIVGTLIENAAASGGAAAH